MPKATNKGSDYTPVPMGVYHAVCYAVIDIGTQPAFGNFPPRRKVMVIWELPHERINLMRDGRETSLPRAINKEYTLSTDKKANLRKDLAAWRGKDFTDEEAEEFEVGNLIGANCQLSVMHKKSADGSKTYANVGSIMPLPKGGEKVRPENPTLVYDIPNEGTIDFPEGLPEWIVNKIKNSEEYIDRANPHKQAQERKEANQEPVDDDVPF